MEQILNFALVYEIFHVVRVGSSLLFCIFSHFKCVAPEEDEEKALGWDTEGDTDLECGVTVLDRANFMVVDDDDAFKVSQKS